MRTCLVLAFLAFATSAAAQDRSLLLRVGMDARELHDEVSLQLAEWDVLYAPVPEGASYLQRAARAESELGDHDAAAWVEQHGGEERLVVITSTEAFPRTSPLPVRSTPDWERVVAMVLEGLVSGEPLTLRLPNVEDASEIDAPRPRARARTNRWPSPLARDGWMFRFGWFFGLNPREVNGVGAYTRDGDAWVEATGGLRLRVGRWLTRFLRVDVSAHFGKTADIGPEGGLDVELMAVSSTRFRMGAGIGFGGLIVSERDGATNGQFGWSGWWVSAPMEVGVDFNRRGGMHLHMGPTWTKPPYLRHAHPGFMMSLETEFDFGTNE